MEEIIQEFPKMLYKHPEDKTKEHKHIVVANEDEQQKAFDKGYQVEPYVADQDGEHKVDDSVIVQGSGSERYGSADTWVDSEGEGITDNTEAKVLVPEDQDSPKDILEFQHMNDKADGEKIEE